MKVESSVLKRMNCAAGEILPALAVAILLAPQTLYAADSKGGAAAKSKEVTFEAIPGSTVKRITLSKKASERLDIRTGKVSEDVIVPKQMVSGLVIAPLGAEAPVNPGGGTFGGFAKSAASPATMAAKPGAANAAAPSGPLWLQISLSPAEWERLAKDKPARVLALPTRTKLTTEVTATLVPRPPVEDSKRSMLTVYYAVSGADGGLELNNRMRIELPLTGNDDKQKVVPYSAVFYDAKGDAWTYVNGTPQTYQRQKIAVSRIAGDVAVLAEGPPVGTPVVVTGAPLLFGTEIFGK